jgi:hypothetical protein
MNSDFRLISWIVLEATRIVDHPTCAITRDTRQSNYGERQVIIETIRNRSENPQSELRKIKKFWALDSIFEHFPATAESCRARNPNLCLLHALDGCRSGACR